MRLTLLKFQCKLKTCLLFSVKKYDMNLNFLVSGIQVEYGGIRFHRNVIKIHLTCWCLIVRVYCTLAIMYLIELIRLIRKLKVCVQITCGFSPSGQNYVEYTTITLCVYIRAVVVDEMYNTLHVNCKCSLNEGRLGKQCTDTDTEAFVTLNKVSINK